MRLTDEELRAVLARAEEIERASRAGSEWSAEVAAVVYAGEELGLSRGAVQRALSERTDLPVAPPAPGTLAWAQSADGKAYVAEVVSLSGGTARVRFLRGTEHEVTLDQLRPCVLIPGERVMCDWPWWGPWTCTVITYDQEKQVVKVSDGSYSTKKFPLAEIWAVPRKTPASKTRARVYAILVGVGVAAGAAIGSAVTAILLR